MIKLDHVAMYVHDLEGVKNFFIRFFSAKANEMYLESCILGPENNIIEITE